MTNSVQFVTNDSGQKTAVVLPIADYERLMEDLGGLCRYCWPAQRTNNFPRAICKRIKTRWHLTVLSGADPQRRIFGEYHRKRLLKLFELLKDWLIIPSRPVVENQWGASALYRIRVGNYRILYEVFSDILIIEIIRVAHRRKAYEE